MSRQTFIRHLLLPSSAPVVLVALYFTPKSVFGWSTRGYMALAVVILALIAACATAMKGITAKREGKTDATNGWIISTLILVSPLVLLAGLLG